MKQDTAKLLVEAATEIGIEATHQDDYSGRNMYGKTTDAIALDNQKDLILLVAVAAHRFGADANDEVRVGDDIITFDEYCEDLGAIKSDSMGHGVIIY